MQRDWNLLATYSHYKTAVAVHWEYSIWNASRQILRINKGRKSGGFYLSEEELREIIAEAYPDAIRRATLEAFEGQYTETQRTREKRNIQR